MDHEEPERLVLPKLIESLLAQKQKVEEILRSNHCPRGEQLHDVRVSLRRIAALARLTRGIPDENTGMKLRKAARNLRRFLSPQRTLEISRHRLRRRFSRDAGKRQFARQLSDHVFQPKHLAGMDTEFEGFLALFDVRFSRRFEELRILSETTGPFGESSAVEKALRETIIRRIEKMKQRLIAAGIPSTETLHAFRIATKDVRYSIEFLENFIPEAKETRKRLREFQDIAGDAHDRVELAAIVARFASDQLEELAVPARPLLPTLEKDSTIAVRRTQRLAGKLLSHLAATRFEFGF